MVGRALAFVGRRLECRKLRASDPFHLMARLPRARPVCYMMKYRRNSEGDGKCLLRRIGPGKLVKANAD